MKKAYVTPTVEKVEFQYNKVVVASGTNCRDIWLNQGDGISNGCRVGEPILNGRNNV